MKKFLAMALALLMVAVLLPVTAMAAEGATGDGSQSNPYTLKQLGDMTRQQYIEAQNANNGTIYVTVGNYRYATNGVLGNGERNDTPGQTPDHSKINAYGENGYRDAGNDGANGKNIVFVDGTITSDDTGYTSIDNIGTSLLLAVPAYTHVTFQGITFNGVISIDYQLYTSPWSQLGCVDFEGCTFNGIIVGAMATQSLVFNNCTFNNYTNTTDANNSNPTWIRPAYGNWTPGDNKGQGSDFSSLTSITFTNNKVTSTRPVKFEFISQWDITTAITATDNKFDISKQASDTSTKNVGLYFGPHQKTNAIKLIVGGNTKSANTAAMYVIPEGWDSISADSSIKNKNGEEIKLTDVMEWKSDKQLTLDPTGNGKDENASTIIIYTPVSSPVFLSGANQTVAPGSAATFRIDKEFSELQSVAVDGVTLDKSNYKAWSGSTYVELTAAYMKTLAVGTHTLSVYFTGDTATTTFTISKDATKNPSTGSNDFVGVAAAAAVMALLGSAVVLRKK